MHDIIYIMFIPVFLEFAGVVFVFQYFLSHWMKRDWKCADSARRTLDFPLKRVSFSALNTRSCQASVRGYTDIYKCTSMIFTVYLCRNVGFGERWRKTFFQMWYCIYCKTRDYGIIWCFLLSLKSDSHDLYKHVIKWKKPNLAELVLTQI